MYETYRILAESRIDEQLRDADAWHLASEAGRARRPAGIAKRIRALFLHDGQRPAPATTGSSLAADGACRP